MITLNLLFCSPYPILCHSLFSSILLSSVCSLPCPPLFYSLSLLLSFLSSFFPLPSPLFPLLSWSSWRLSCTPVKRGTPSLQCSRITTAPPSLSTRGSSSPPSNTVSRDAPQYTSMERDTERGKETSRDREGKRKTERKREREEEEEEEEER